MIEITNGDLIAHIDEGLGAELVYLGTKDVNFLASYDWESPISCQKSSPYENPLFNFMSSYKGGWQALFPNAGNSASVLGVELPFHGEFCRSKVEVVEVLKNRVVVKSGTRIPLTLTRTYTISLETNTLEIQQVATNESALEVPFIWGEHPAFNLPAGSKIKIPGAGVVVEQNNKGDFLDLPETGIGNWPFVDGADGRKFDLSIVPSKPTERLCYLTDISEAWTAMEFNSHLIGMSWDKDAFPHMWFWQQIGGLSFPWFGRANITALEPASSWPSHGLEVAIQNKQAFYLRERESKSAWITFVLGKELGKKIDDVIGVNQFGDFSFVKGSS
jgi:galactose mutarotase-like enzyme